MNILLKNQPPIFKQFEYIDTPEQIHVYPQAHTRLAHIYETRHPLFHYCKTCTRWNVLLKLTKPPRQRWCWKKEEKEKDRKKDGDKNKMQRFKTRPNASWQCGICLLWLMLVCLFFFLLIVCSNFFVQWFSPRALQKVIDWKLWHFVINF